MHPNTFLKTFWRLTLKPQVFVAMSFDEKYKGRYEQVIVPAINRLTVNGKQLEPYRVDISSSGDSIITCINDGIAHSQLVLADVSTIGKDEKTGITYRNSNVMYEVGIALACRQPCEVLIIRDDNDKLLFDVTTIPHATIDFSMIEDATKTLSEQLLARINEQQYIYDARVRIAIATLSSEEVILIKKLKKFSSYQVWGLEVKGLPPWYALAINRLLDKGLVQLAGEFTDDKPAFIFTQFGYIIQQMINAGLHRYNPDPVTDDAEKPC